MKDLRERALAILDANQGGNKPLGVDYVIDDECRRVLDLPARPANAKPYVGWMVGETKAVGDPTKTSQAGVDLIKKWEGLRTQSYLCPASVWTIGYGHTKTAEPGQVISSVKAEELLKEDLVRFENAVNRYVRVPIDQNQFDALVSFAFNVGTEALRTSSLLRILNEGRYKTAASQFKKWVFAAGKKLPGLVSRRNEEYRLFLSK